MSEVTESVGRYLSTIHLLTQEADRRAKTGELADALGVSGASVTEMLTSLDERGLAAYRKYEGVTLTDHGEEVAREFMWRHCVAEKFLEDDLGLDPAELEDGETPRAIGQALSKGTAYRLKDFVDHPCDGKCSAPHDAYTVCTDDVREQTEDAEP